MKLFLTFYIVLCGGNLFAQTKVGVYDYFDFESSYDDYASVYAQFHEENIKGNVRELKKISSRINFHVKLNKRGEIIECLKYADSSKLSRVKIYESKKIIREIEFDASNTPTYIFYEYNDSGKLISKTYSRSRKNKNPRTTVTYAYNDRNQLILRILGKKAEEKFIYEGDSIEWKLISNRKNELNGVARRFKKAGYQLETLYRLDSFSNAGFEERITPTKDFEQHRDDNGNIIEQAEYSYDSHGNRIQTKVSKYGYNGDQLIKSSSVYNTDDMKGESSYDYFYDVNGLLQSAIHKSGNRIDTIRYTYDKQGNVTDHMGSKYRYTYDSKGNWVVKERFQKGKSYGTQIKNGVLKTETFKDDMWLIQETRVILYY